MHASRRLVAFRQPDAEAVRGELTAGAEPPKTESDGRRHRTREVEELAPVLAVESFERPIFKTLRTAAGNPEAETSNFQLEGEIVLNKRARSKVALSTTTNLPGHILIDDARPHI